MAELEDELRVQNWLSIVTFDVFKYITAGGAADVGQGEEGLVITLKGVDINSEGINKKLRRLFAESEKVATAENVL